MFCLTLGVQFSLTHTFNFHAVSNKLLSIYAMKMVDVMLFWKIGVEEGLG